ncbi:hypothetical protein CgunFtcFv8_021511 [Champsocephalus gunnari]|uniref:Uncharacterized protein n=1 Tax=Champsocephalus gunnari TaxID=52237 RepID=A0AAN8HRQ1_CHAGU|nr:hypothetical protein CgunFtcFv8_021511 [Champsocephalus gunnari]
MLKRSDGEMSCCPLDWRKDTVQSSGQHPSFNRSALKSAACRLAAARGSSSLTPGARAFSRFLSGLRRCISFPEKAMVSQHSIGRGFQPCLGANGFD